jgi:hypothetical protein
VPGRAEPAVEADIEPVVEPYVEPVAKPLVESALVGGGLRCGGRAAGDGGWLSAARRGVGPWVASLNAGLEPRVEAGVETRVEPGVEALVEGWGGLDHPPKSVPAPHQFAVLRLPDLRARDVHDTASRNDPRSRGVDSLTQLPPLNCSAMG